jgi:ribonuclease HI
MVEGHPDSTHTHTHTHTHTIIETDSLPPTTTSQQAELCALTQALQRAKDKTVDIYMDSKYTYNNFHYNKKIWKEEVF